MKITRRLTSLIRSLDGELTDEMKMKWTPCSPGDPEAVEKR